MAADQGRATWKLIMVVLVVTFGTNFQIYNTSVVNNPQVIIQDWFNSSSIARHGHGFSSGQLDIIWAMTVACVHFGAVIGSIATGPVAELLGRKKGLMLVSVISIIGSVLAGTAKLAGVFEMVIVGRLLIGIGLGIGFGLAGMFLTEIPIVRLRGACGTVQQLFVGFGDFFSLTVTLPQVLGTPTMWPIAFALPALPALLQLIVLPFCPESPRYAYLTKGDVVEATRAITFYQGEEMIELAIAELESEKRALGAARQVNVFGLCKYFRFRKPLLIALAVALGVQLSGISAVMAYSTSMFMDANISETTAKYATSGVGFVNFATPFFIIFLIEMAGRRRLILIGFWGCLISLVGVTIFTELSAHLSVTWAAYMGIAALVTYQMSFAIAAPVEWFIVCELFNQSARSAATTVNSVALWGGSTLLVLGYLPFKNVVGVSLSYLPFIAALLCCITYVTLYLPETKGRRIQSITEAFHRRNKKRERERRATLEKVQAEQMQDYIRHIEKPPQKVGIQEEYERF